VISPIEPVAGGAPSSIVGQVEAIFSATGPFSKASNFEYRPQQQAMAMAVAQALESEQHLMVEAGTGVGKSFAYLVPAVLYAFSRKKKAIICTHTINLQEQLVEKDLPVLQQVLGVPFTFTMLKGRGNYLCTGRLRKVMQQADSLFTSSETQELRRIYEWSKTTEDGSLSDFDQEPDRRVWEQVCSERGLCTPKRCGHTSDLASQGAMCFFQRARQKILSSDVLVLNHTLFFSLLNSLDSDERSKCGAIFRNDFVIFDEAHTVEQVAARHIGLSVSSGQLRFSLQRLWNPRTEKGLLATLRAGNKIGLVAEALEAGEKFFDAVEQACEEIIQKTKPPSYFSRGAEDPVDNPPQGRANRNRFSTSTSGAQREWSELRIRRPELVPDTVSLTLIRLREAIHELIKLTEDKELGEELVECNHRLDALSHAVTTFLKQDVNQHVYWVERGGKSQRSLVLNAAPVDVAEYLRRRLFGLETSMILTSATLSVRDATRNDANETLSAVKSGRPQVGRGAGLEYVARRVGADNARKLQVGSPFDYARQMELKVVSKMPDPRDEEYEKALAYWIEHFIRETHGKAFVLFTSYRLMQTIASQLAPLFEQMKLEVFVQGSGIPRATMLERFKEDVDSVLFGTDSFWQGVDVPGESLSNVVITRLPFSVPDHPLTEARLEQIEAKGGNAFFEFSLPEAILKFRQGVGRLIRTKSDSGMVVVLDNRVLTKRYGQAFLDAIPQCPVTIV